MKRASASIVTLMVSAALLAVMYVNRQTIKDQYVVHASEVSPNAYTLMGNLDLTNRGAFIYKASQPQVQTATEFNTSCGNVIREHSIVLGCYTRQRLFVYDVTDQRLNGVKEVTAAHEMLHAAYERLPQKERIPLNNQLKTAAASIEDQRFKDTLADYKQTEPDQIENELHSILGTEIAVLPSPLEKYYQKYFNNRSKIVAYSNQYAKTFTDIDAQIKSFDTTLANLREQKESLEFAINNLKTAIDNKMKQMNSLRGSGDIQAYNQLVPEYNQQINAYNSKVDDLKSIVNNYNSVVKQRNELATTQNELVKQLDSNYSPIQ